MMGAYTAGGHSLRARSQPVRAQDVLSHGASICLQCLSCALLLLTEAMLRPAAHACRGPSTGQCTASAGSSAVHAAPWRHSGDSQVCMRTFCELQPPMWRPRARWSTFEVAIDVAQLGVAVRRKLLRILARRPASSFDKHPSMSRRNWMKIHIGVFS